MALDRKRRRLVSFRLSEQEYQTLHNSTVVEGARSLSDFARRALCTTLDRNTRGIAGPGHPERVTVNNDTLEQLVTTMSELSRVINRLSVLVETNSRETLE